MMEWWNNGGGVRPGFDPAHGGGGGGPWPPHACRGQGSTSAMGAVEENELAGRVSS
jgi:hypothetical protein